MRQRKFSGAAQKPPRRTRMRLQRSVCARHGQGELDNVTLEVVPCTTIRTRRDDVAVTAKQFAKPPFIPLAFIEQEALPDLVSAPLDGRRLLPCIARRIEQP